MAFWSVTMAVAYIVLLLLVGASLLFAQGESFPDAAFAECDDLLAGVLSAFVYAWAQQRLSACPVGRLRRSC
jgi:hypothetical protein